MHESLEPSNPFIFMNIGNLTFENKAFLAPMAGITHPVFRWMVREVGGAVGFTEMVSAEGIVRDFERAQKYLEPFPGEKPFAVQLFGADPGAVAAAAVISVEQGADLIDINMGCPVRKVVKAGAGAALMRDPGKLAALLRKVRAALHCPLTVKIRSGWTAGEILAPDMARIARDSGVDAIIVHPRTVAQGFSGKADWPVIERVKKAVEIPVIGNGDIRTAEDALRMMDETGCEGIMVGRGVLGNPWIFSAIRGAIGGGSAMIVPTPAEREAVVCSHLDRNIRFFGERDGIKDFYRHLSWYTKGMRGCAALRKQVLGEENHEEVRDAIHRFFALTQRDRPPEDEHPDASSG